MSRTFKDKPYRVLEREALEHTVRVPATQLDAPDRTADP